MKDCWKIAILCARAGSRSTPGTGGRVPAARVRRRGGELMGGEWAVPRLQLRLAKVVVLRNGNHSTVPYEAGKAVSRAP